MKVPKQMKRFCPFCNGHQEHVVDRKKTSGRGKAGFKKADRRRRHLLSHGYGGSPYPLQANGVKYGAKTSQKILLRYKCKKCGKMHQIKSPPRAKKFEIVK